MRRKAEPARQTASTLNRAVASLLRLADSDLKDAELLSSGRHPDNAPALLQLASERLVHAVLATELGWPLASPAAGISLVPAENPLREAMANLVTASAQCRPPAVADDGSLPPPLDAKELRTKILAARAVLKTLAGTFEVDLFGAGPAGRVSPTRPVIVPQPQPDEPAAKSAPKPEPERPTPSVVPLPPERQRAAPRATPAASPKSDEDALARSTRLSVPRSTPAPVPEPHAVEGRAPIEVKQGSASVASTPFWTLMDSWNIPDQAALDLIGHPGGLTKKGTRPRFKLVSEEAALLRSFQEIDAALRPLGLEPQTWLHQPIKSTPFDGATPAAYLTRRRKQGVQDTLRFILQHGLRLSMSNNRGRTG